MKNKCKHVYAVLCNDGTIKIGITNNIKKRFRAIETAAGKRIINEFYSESTPNAKKIESLIFRKFSLFRKTGEWFRGVPFDDVVLHMKFYDYSDQEGIY